MGESIASAMDYLLGWLLHLPTDVALVLIALGTSLVLAIVRLVTTDQDLLHRVAEDKRTLRQLARQARANGNKADARRHRENITHITWHSLGRTLKGEGLTLLAAIVPLALVGTWCFYRLEYHPPKASQPVEFSLITPASEIDTIVHLVPQRGVQCSSGWVQPIQEDALPRGIARWQLIFEPRAEPYELMVRHGNQSLAHPVIVGQRQYLPPEVAHDTRFTRIALEPVKLFNLVPGLPQLALPPWAVAYLLLAIAGTFVVKSILHIR